LRLAVLFALATALVIAGGGAAFVLQLRLSVDASLDPGLRSRVAVVADELGTQRGLAPVVSADSIVQVSTLEGRIRTASPEAGTTSVLDAAQREQALTGEVSFTATVNGDRSRVLATTAAAGGDRVLVVVGTGTDVSDAAVQRAVSALVLGGSPAAVRYAQIVRQWSDDLVYIAPVGSADAPSSRPLLKPSRPHWTLLKV
jgi:hypothetical protein